MDVLLVIPESGIALAGRSKQILLMQIWNDAKAPDALRASVQQSLADLACGHLDLLLLQWPNAWKPGTQEADPAAMLPETWQAMEALQDEGVVRQLGVANFSLPDVEALLESARVKPVANFVELHPLLAQRKLVGTLLRKARYARSVACCPVGGWAFAPLLARTFCKAALDMAVVVCVQGVQCVAHSPLGGRDGTSCLVQHEVTQALAKEGHALEELLLKWNVQRGIPVVVDGANGGALFQQPGSIDGFHAWKLNEEQQKVREKPTLGIGL